jgi:hypothetical protein
MVTASAGVRSLSRGELAAYFLATILGFSFWFFAAVPFASHRETYGWLGSAVTQSLPQQFAFGHSSTYRPLSQAVIFSLFQWLDPAIFPTNVVRQAVLQVAVYACFVAAWWLVYSAVPQRRVFAVIALICGGVLFPSYVHLFHIYGLMYVPVILTLGAVTYLQAAGTLERHALSLTAATTVLTLWHPFAAAIFVACYAGLCLQTYAVKTPRQHVRSVLLLATASAAVFAVVVLFPRDHNALDSRLVAFLASYRTHEINRVASVAVLGLSAMATFSTFASARARWLAVIATTLAGIALIGAGVPVLLLWFTVAAVKLARLRRWAMGVLMVTAALLPFGGATGTPIHTLFGVVVATYATALGFHAAEQALVRLTPRYVLAASAVAVVAIVLLRLGVAVPIVSRAAAPLLAERERTYQLESAIAWLHRSPYCSSSINFSEQSGSPVDSIESAVTRRNRPPAGIKDVQYFWDNVLRCRPSAGSASAVVTFGGAGADGFQRVHSVPGKYAEEAVVWVAPGHTLTQR